MEYADLGDVPYAENRGVSLNTEPRKGVLGGRIRKKKLAKPPYVPGVSPAQDKRHRGGVKCGEKKRARAHDAIDQGIGAYVNMLAVEWWDPKRRFVMSRFIRDVLPNLTDVKDAVRRYGDYIKARLKYHEESGPVMKMGMLIDKIRARLAAKAGKPAPVPLFQSIPGYLHRVSSNIWKTTSRFCGANWMPNLGCWAYFVSPDGEIVA